MVTIATIYLTHSKQYLFYLIKLSCNFLETYTR